MINGARLLLVLCLVCLAATLKLAEQKEGAVQSHAQQEQGRRVKLLRHRKGTGNETGEVDSDDTGAESQADAGADTTQNTGGETVDDDGVSQDDVIEVSAGKEVAQLHMVMYNLPPGPFVRVDAVDPGLWADKAGIEAGSEIVTINGKVAKDLTMKGFIAMLKARPVRMTIKPPQEVASLGGPAPAAAAGVMQNSIAVNAVGPAPAPPVPALKPGKAVPAKIAKVEAKKAQAKIDKIATGKSDKAAAKQKGAAKAPKAAVASKTKVAKAGKGKAPDLPLPPDSAMPANADKLAKAAYAAAVVAGRAAGAAAGQVTAKQLVAELKNQLGISTGFETPPSAAVPPPMVPVVQPDGSVAPAPAPFAWKPVAPQPVPKLPSAPSTASVSAGDKVIPMVNSAGFAIGQDVIIGAGTPTEEGNTIAGFGSLILKYPLKFAHVAGTLVSAPPDAGPPEPVPPSPLDALKAAMAIRANATGGQAPLLPNDVMDRVAEMVRGRLGGFLPPSLAGAPCPPGSPAAAAAPAGAPAAAPAPAFYAGPVLEKVEITMTLKNMSFTALSASPSMMAEFEQSVKQTIAESSGPGVKGSDVEVRLKAGSVIIESKITPPSGMKASDMDRNLAKGSSAIGARMVARVAVLPGIDTIALGEISATGIVVKVVREILPTTTTTTTPPPIRRLAKPPKCGAAPPKMTKGEVAMALAPFRPPGASHKAVLTKDGGKAWPLEDGGWAFQYPDMALRMQADGSTRIVWEKPAYSVEYDESGISYHVGQSVVHRDTNGDVTYEMPTGTMHQEGSTLVYHWCNPNVIVYQTPSGFVYYDDLGMTYRSFGEDVTHYTWSGEVLYQGAGGVTSQRPDGTVTHWTDAGAIFRHPDGSVTYTPVGERTSQALSVGDLGPDPFPGDALSTAALMGMTVPAAAPNPAIPMVR